MDTWVEDAAARYWRDAGEAEPFPRTLDGSIPLALRVSVEALHGLRLSSAGRWLREHGGGTAWRDAASRALADRPLRGCLVALDGQGCIFVDADDPADEQRFTLAHEAAHFILDYDRPRTLVARRLGAPLLRVLDGGRAATTTERLDAALSGVDITPHTHLFERGPLGRHSGRVAEAESNADRLAIELLAPEGLALPLVPAGGPYRRRLEAGAAALRASFGLPPPIAAAYARALARERGDGEDWGSWVLGDC